MKRRLEARARSDHALGAAAASEEREEGECVSQLLPRSEPALAAGECVSVEENHCVTDVSFCLIAPVFCNMFPFTSAVLE